MSGSGLFGGFRNGFRIRWSCLALLVLAGCTQASAARGRSQETAVVDYGPNPLADCLRWPKDAPHIEPLYAP